MRIVFKLLWQVTIIAVMLLGCSCPEDETVVFTTVLSADVQQLIDNGYLEEGLEPVGEQLEDFYFAETPEMLDSLFYYYPPVLDSLFPEGGSLLILYLLTNVEDEVLGYSMEASADTVRIFVEIRYRDVGSPEPGIREWVFPVGVVLEPETPAE
jgi:hypothetical protein